jgi:hypothetical protein
VWSYTQFRAADCFVTKQDSKVVFVTHIDVESKKVHGVMEDGPRNVQLTFDARVQQIQAPKPSSARGHIFQSVIFREVHVLDVRQDWQVGKNQVALTNT